jgi:peptide/nickel transport system ATP-binding protein
VDKSTGDDRNGYVLRTFITICDEPTTALDVTVQKTILELIRELQQQANMGVIFITMI